MKRYFDQTSTLTYSFIASIPLFVLYEVLIRISQPGEEALIRLSADIWISQILYLFHENTLLLSIGVLLILGGFILYRDRNQSIKLKSGYFGLMIVESTIWAVVLAMLVSGFIGWLFMVSSSGSEVTRLQMLALSIGAGLYEELVFRVILVYSLIWLLQKLMDDKPAIIISVIVGAAIFSAVHYVGTFGDTFTLSSFLFRMLFGLALNALLVIRGFGITAWTHSLYNVILVVFFYK